MLKRDSVFFGIILLFSNVTLLSTIYTIFSIGEHANPVVPGTMIWLPVVIICYLGLNMFLRRERTIRAAIIFALLFFLAQCVMVFMTYGKFAGFLGIGIAIFMWIYTYYKSYMLVLEPIKAEQLLGSFEFCTIILIFALFTASFSEKITESVVVPIAIAAGASLVALILHRTSGSDNKGNAFRGSAIIATVFCVLVGSALIFVMSGTDFINKAVLTAWNFIYFMIDKILSVLFAIINFLLSLIPFSGEGEIPPSESIPAGEAEGVVPYPENFGEAVMYGIFGIILLIIAVIIIYRIKHGKTNVSIGKTRSKKGLRRHRMGLFGILATFFRRNRQTLNYRVNCIIKYNTAPGLLASLEKQFSVKKQGRRSGESCREFLQRIAPAYPGASGVLESLADALDARYFGNGDTLTARDISEMRRTLNASRKSSH